MDERREKSLRGWFYTLMNLYLNSGEKEKTYLDRLEAAHDALCGVGRGDVWQAFRENYLQSSYGDRARPLFEKIEKKGWV